MQPEALKYLYDIKEAVLKIRRFTMPLHWGVVENNVPVLLKYLGELMPD